MKCIAYRVNGRAAALETDRLYRHLETGRLTVRIADGRLRDASPEEEAAVAEQLGEGSAPGGDETPDFAAMSKLELEAWARDRHGVNLDRRRRKEALIEEVRALTNPQRSYGSRA